MEEIKQEPDSEFHMEQIFTCYPHEANGSCNVKVEEEKCGMNLMAKDGLKSTPADMLQVVMENSPKIKEEVFEDHFTDTKTEVISADEFALQNNLEKPEMRVTKVDDEDSTSKYGEQFSLRNNTDNESEKNRSSYISVHPPSSTDVGSSEVGEISTRGIKSNKCDISESKLPLHIPLNNCNVVCNETHYDCNTCNKSFTQVDVLIENPFIPNNILKRHEHLHNGGNTQGYNTFNKAAANNLKRNKRTYECDVCKKKFPKKCNVDRHMLIHLGMKPYKCDVCNKSFTRLNDLTGHQFVHTGESPHKCDICNKTFLQKQSLTVHQISHTGQRPHKCDICNKTFVYKSDLRRHKLLHAEQKDIKCDACNKTFKHISKLKKHEVVHTGEGPHKCDVCNKAFAMKTNLTVHKRLHTGEKPHKCDVCNKSFSQPSNYRAHLLIHTGERLHKCDVCMKSFKDRTGLKRHMFTHTGDRPHICSICGKTFRHLCDLRKHERLH